MSKKGNEFGVFPRYAPGDRVRVWKVFKHPIGIVEHIVDADCFPIKYLVRYHYHDGRDFEEVFEANDLTLFDRLRDFKCNCDTKINMHAIWCNIGK